MKLSWKHFERTFISSYIMLYFYFYIFIYNIKKGESPFIFIHFWEISQSDFGMFTLERHSF